MMTHSVPSHCSVAHLPAVAGRIAVPFAPPAKGATLALALTTATLAVFFTNRNRPGVNTFVTGLVNVTVTAAENETVQSVELVVYVAVDMKRGVLHAKAPMTFRLPSLVKRIRSNRVPAEFIVPHSHPMGTLPALTAASTVQVKYPDLM